MSAGCLRKAMPQHLSDPGICRIRASVGSGHLSDPGICRIWPIWSADDAPPSFYNLCVHNPLATPSSLRYVLSVNIALPLSLADRSSATIQALRALVPDEQPVGPPL